MIIIKNIKSLTNLLSKHNIASFFFLYIIVCLQWCYVFLAFFAKKYIFTGEFTIFINIFFCYYYLNFIFFLFLLFLLLIFFFIYKSHEIEAKSKKNNNIYFLSDI